MSSHKTDVLLNDYLRAPLNTPVPPELTSQGIALLPALESHLREARALAALRGLHRPGRYELV